MKWFRRYNRHVEDLNAKRIKQILSKLNKGKTGPWQPVEGFNTMLALKPGFITWDVNNNLGLTVKAFINNITGEIKTYFLDRVKLDEE